MLRRSINKREKQLFVKRFYPAGTYTWTVPAGCEEVDVFLVGGGGGGGYSMHSGGGGGGGGQVMRSSVRVTPGEEIQCTIGQGGSSGYGTGVYTGMFVSVVLSFL